MKSTDHNTYKVAICAATGNQGKEVISRFNEINESESYGSKVFHLKALTRNKFSDGAKRLSKVPNVTIAATDYSSESLMKVFSGVDALYLNYAMVKNEAEVEKTIIDAALESGVQHIVYASNVGCEKDHGVPHWISSYKTEEYLKERYSKDDGKDFKYHFMRLAHFNENFTPGSYFPPKNGKITYPWNADALVATSSLRDAARVACKLFAEPCKLPNGSYIDAITEDMTSTGIAAAISKATGETVTAVKGPWIFTAFGQWFGWEANTILCMAKYIDVNNCNGFDLDAMRNFLQEEIEDGEPLETIENFAKRHFSKKDMDKTASTVPNSSEYGI